MTHRNHLAFKILNPIIKWLQALWVTTLTSINPMTNEFEWRYFTVKLISCVKPFCSYHTKEDLRTSGRSTLIEIPVTVCVAITVHWNHSRFVIHWSHGRGLVMVMLEYVQCYCPQCTVSMFVDKWSDHPQHCTHTHGHWHHWHHWLRWWPLLLVPLPATHPHQVSMYSARTHACVSGLYKSSIINYN